MRRKKERSKQGQTNKQGKATQHIQGTHVQVTALGVLCCFALFVCLTLLASFFHLSLKHVYYSLHVSMYLHDVQGSCITDVGEGYGHGGINDCLQFVEFLVPIERRLTVK